MHFLEPGRMPAEAAKQEQKAGLISYSEQEVNDSCYSSNIKMTGEKFLYPLEGIFWF